MKLLFAFVLIASLSFATLNPAAAEEATMLIVKSGNVSFSGLNVANLTMPIPQSGIQSMEVSGADWSVIRDAYGNSALLLSWNRSYRGGDYEVTIVAKSRASYSDSKAMTKLIVANSGVLPRTAPRTLEGAAELSSFVHDYMAYDLNLTGANKPLDWILDNRRGVCVEFATLLKALAEASGMETRYVLGYAYSAVEAKPVGHAWLEVKAEDGTWIGSDPTWNEAGYVDATHVVTSRGSVNQSELFSYVASSAEWKRNDERVELVDYTARPPTSLALGVLEGALQSNVSVQGCAIVEAEVAPCVTREGEDALRITNKTQEALVCNSGEFSWAFNATQGDYSCHVRVSDQYGSAAETTVTVSSVGNDSDIIKNIIAWIYSILGLL